MARRPSAAARRGGADELVRVDTQELRALITRLRDVQDRKLKAALRKTLREAADIAVEGVREEVLKPPPEKIDTRILARFRRRKVTRSRSSGLRADIAKATKASLTKGSAKNGGQVSIVTANSRMQPRHKGMAKAYNAYTFRHPVFADSVNGMRDSRTRGFRRLAARRKAEGRTLTSWRWVQQHGQRNYFGKGVAGRRNEMMRRLQAAMDDVTKKL